MRDEAGRRYFQRINKPKCSLHVSKPNEMTVLLASVLRLLYVHQTIGMSFICIILSNILLNYYLINPIDCNYLFAILCHNLLQYKTIALIYSFPKSLQIDKSFGYFCSPLQIDFNFLVCLPYFYHCAFVPAFIHISNASI